MKINKSYLEHIIKEELNNMAAATIDNAASTTKGSKMSQLERYILSEQEAGQLPFIPIRPLRAQKLKNKENRKKMVDALKREIMLSGIDESDAQVRDWLRRLEDGGKFAGYHVAMSDAFYKEFGKDAERQILSQAMTAFKGSFQSALAEMVKYYSNSVHDSLVDEWLEIHKDVFDTETAAGYSPKAISGEFIEEKVRQRFGQLMSGRFFWQPTLIGLHPGVKASSRVSKIIRDGFFSHLSTRMAGAFMNLLEQAKDRQRPEVAEVPKTPKLDLQPVSGRGNVPSITLKEETENKNMSTFILPVDIGTDKQGDPLGKFQAHIGGDEIDALEVTKFSVSFNKVPCGEVNLTSAWRLNAGLVGTEVGGYGMPIKTLTVERLEDLVKRAWKYAKKKNIIGKGEQLTYAAATVLERIKTALRGALQPAAMPPVAVAATGLPPMPVATDDEINQRIDKFIGPVDDDTPLDAKIKKFIPNIQQQEKKKIKAVVKKRLSFIERKRSAQKKLLRKSSAWPSGPKTIKDIQEELRAYFPEKSVTFGGLSRDTGNKPDGKYGRETYEAIVKLQKDDLAFPACSSGNKENCADGLWGPKTAAAWKEHFIDRGEKDASTRPEPSGSASSAKPTAAAKKKTDPVPAPTPTASSGPDFSYGSHHPKGSPQNP